MPDPDSRHRLGREHPRIERLGRVFGRDDLLPIDPDLAPDDPSTPASTHRPATPVLHRRDPRILGSIALGGFAGTVARYGVARAFPTAVGGFPWATFVINTSGAFLLGLLLTLILERWRVSRYLRPVTCVGLLGAWTTMSTLAFEADVLAKDGHADVAAAYLVATLVAGLAATSFGIAIGRPSRVMR